MRKLNAIHERKFEDPQIRLLLPLLSLALVKRRIFRFETV